ncbi:MAG: hypothetical protein ACXWMH_12075 [Syntrophales bacterium]
MRKSITRKMIFLGCGLLLVLGGFACTMFQSASPPLESLTFSGSKDFTGEPFEINTREWQINWEYKAVEKKPPTFVLYVYPEGDKVNWIEMVKGPAFNTNGNTYLYKGKGRYYIKVRANNLENWQVGIVRSGVNEPLKLPATFTGNTDTTTKPFKIQKKEFKINYVMETPLMAGQSIAIYSREETENYVGMTTVGAGSGTLLYKGTGEYYIKVQCTGVKNWKMDVIE